MSEDAQSPEESNHDRTMKCHECGMSEEKVSIVEYQTNEGKEHLCSIHAEEWSERGKLAR